MREGEAKERRRGRVRGSRGSRRRRGESPRRRGGEGRRQAGRWRGATARACAVSLLCLLAEVEDDWHQASWLGCPLGQPGKGPGKTLSPFSNYFSFLFCRFVLNLVLKPIQFILLLTIFLGAKRIKTMLHKNISELLDLYLFNSRYKSNSNNYCFNSNAQIKCF